jgi:alpha-tubulin suppressor-like RCC1 family protein
MSMRYKGGVISATPPTVTAPVGGEGGSASGIWSLETQGQYAGSSEWPKPTIYTGLWVWGRNTSGSLGTGNTTNYSSPVQVGALLDWKDMSGGEGHTIATRKDGTLWSWGTGGSGRTGQGNTND